MNHIQKMNKDLLKMAEKTLPSLVKSGAIHRIKLQPFYGNYWSGKKTIETVKFRR